MFRAVVTLTGVHLISSGLLNQVNDTGRSVTFSTPKTTPPPKSVHDVQNPPHTPPTVRRRSAPSLHRAVVLRLAQRALERERYEEEQEEDEVEAVVSPERELGPLELSSDEDEHDDEEEHEEQDQPVIPSVCGLLPSETFWRRLNFYKILHRPRLLNLLEGSWASLEPVSTW